MDAIPIDRWTNASGFSTIAKIGSKRACYEYMKTRPDLEWKNGKVVPCRLLVFEGYCNGKVIFGIEGTEFWLGLFNGKNLALPECLNFIFRYAKINGCNIVTSAPHPVGDRAHKLYFKYHPDGYWYRNI